MPACHVIALFLDGLLPMELGAAVYFADGDALRGTLIDNLREVRPTVFVGVPRVFEKLEEKMRELGRSAPAPRRALVEWAKRTATEHHRVASCNRDEHGRAEAGFKMKMARKLVLR